MSNIERCWVCTKVGASLDADGVVVMWDTASADYYRARGWTVVEFVPANDAGAVSLIEQARYCVTAALNCSAHPWHGSDEARKWLIEAARLGGQVADR